MLTNIKTAILELKGDIYNIITDFQSGHENAATLKVATVTQKILNVLADINSSGINEGLLIDYNNLNTILLNVTRSIENENYILIDDLFEYELIPIFDTWIFKLEDSISMEAAHEEK